MYVVCIPDSTDVKTQILLFIFGPVPSSVLILGFSMKLFQIFRVHHKKKIQSHFVISGMAKNGS